MGLHTAPNTKPERFPPDTSSVRMLHFCYAAFYPSRPDRSWTSLSSRGFFNRSVKCNVYTHMYFYKEKDILISHANISEINVFFVRILKCLGDSLLIFPPKCSYAYMVLNVHLKLFKILFKKSCIMQFPFFFIYLSFYILYINVKYIHSLNALPVKNIEISKYMGLRRNKYCNV